jgi:hypothetical protein
MKDVLKTSLTCLKHGVDWDLLLGGSFKMIEGILDPNGAPLSNLGVHSGLGESAEEGSYRNTLII